MPSLWLVPAAFAAHVAEEAPGFTSWARRNTSRRVFHAGTTVAYREYSPGLFTAL